jgi:hypothetical protein
MVWIKFDCNALPTSRQFRKHWVCINGSDLLLGNKQQWNDFGWESKSTTEVSQKQNVWTYTFISNTQQQQQQQQQLFRVKYKYKPQQQQ